MSNLDYDDSKPEKVRDLFRRPKFAFWFVIALIALIYICYVMFMSVTYYLNGDYMTGAMVAGVAFVVMTIMVYWLQRKKGVNHKFDKNVKEERVLLVLFTILCIGCFVIYSHFWTVKKSDDIIVSSFNQILDEANDMFESYDQYANSRILSVDDYTDKNYQAGDVPALVVKKTIRLQLQPKRLQEMEDDFYRWVKTSKEGISIWNVFLAGNANNLCERVRQWNDQLSDFSSVRLFCEDLSLPAFDSSSTIYKAADQLAVITPLYSQTGMPSVMAYLTGAVAFFLLYLPWILQSRSPRSTVTLWGKRKFKHGGATLNAQTEKVEIERRKGHLDESQQVKSRHRAGTLQDDGKPRRRAKSLDREGE